MKTEGSQDRERLFKEIYRATFPKLYKIFHQSLKCDELTNDVLQETYLKLWSKLDELDGRQDYMPFLFFYARNFARKEIASRLNQVDIDNVPLPMMHIADMGNELDIKEFRENITRAIDNLPPKRRMVYRMFKDEGLSYKHIAKVLNISSKTVDNHLNEASKTLKNRLLSDYRLKNTIVIYLISYVSFLWR